MGSAVEHWYYAGRDHLFFAVEADMHCGELSALALPSHPPGLRERLIGSRELALERATLLADANPSILMGERLRMSEQRSLDLRATGL